jgi:hypothetical protein
MTVTSERAVSSSSSRRIYNSRSSSRRIYNSRSSSRRIYNSRSSSPRIYNSRHKQPPQLRTTVRAVCGLTASTAPHERCRAWVGVAATVAHLRAVLVALDVHGHGEALCEEDGGVFLGRIQQLSEVLVLGVLVVALLLPCSDRLAVEDDDLQQRRQQGRT